MNNEIKNLLKNQNKILFDYLAIYTTVFLILSLIYYTFFFIFVKDKTDFQIISFCFTPFLSSFIVMLIGKYTSKKYPKVTKIVANIINLTVLTIHFYFTFYALMIIILFSGVDNKEYTEIKDYQNALNSYFREAIDYFPSKIPDNAQNVSLYRSPVSFTGDSEFYLKFDIDKKYVETVTKKYRNQSEKFTFNTEISYETDNFHNNEAAGILKSIIGESIEDWTVLLLERTQCFKGIASKNNTIIYILYCD